MSPLIPFGETGSDGFGDNFKSFIFLRMERQLQSSEVLEGCILLADCDEFGWSLMPICALELFGIKHVSIVEHVLFIELPLGLEEVIRVNLMFFDEILAQNLYSCGSFTHKLLSITRVQEWIINAHRVGVG
jgi:hypothetical protein